MTLSSLSIFFPAYNDARTIGPLVKNALEVAASITSDFEVIVINDGSQDNTAVILNQLQAEHPQVRVIHHPVNRGYGGALRSGFRAASKDYVFYTDGDAQYDVRELSRLAALMRPGIDLVQGYKLNRDDALIRKVIGRLYHRAVSLLFGLGVRDVDCDFRLLRRHVLNSITLQHNSGIICAELMSKVQQAGFTIRETGVSHFARPHGRSQFFRPRHLVQTARGLGMLWLEMRRERRASLEGRALNPG